MKSVKTALLALSIIMLSSSISSYSSYAAYRDFDQKKQALINDKSITDATKKELEEYFKKAKAMGDEHRARKQEMREKLSPDAKSAMKKHFARRYKNSSPEQAKTNK